MPNWAWRTIVGIGVIVALLGGLFTIDQHYAKSDELTVLAKTVRSETCSSLKLAEAETVKTFQGFQLQQTAMNKAIQLQILNIQKDSLDKEYWGLKKQIRINPLDKELQIDFSDVKIQRIKMKEKIEKKLWKNN